MDDPTRLKLPKVQEANGERSRSPADRRIRMDGGPGARRRLVGKGQTATVLSKDRDSFAMFQLRVGGTLRAITLRAHRRCRQRQGPQLVLSRNNAVVMRCRS